MSVMDQGKFDLHGRTAPLRLVAHDLFWSGVAHLLRRHEPPGTRLELDNRRARRVLDVDVCIVTNGTYPGGNSATTVTEVQAFEAAGLSVAVVHCSIKRSRWKWNRVAERYRPVLDRIIAAHWVGRITCRTVIVRAPRVMLTDAFARLAPKIRPQKAIFVVNNSAWNEEGGAVFSWPAIHRRFAAIDWPNKELCPLGPLIREEAIREMAAAGMPASTNNSTNGLLSGTTELHGVTDMMTISAKT